MSRPTAHEHAEDVADLLAAGESPEEVARRLGLAVSGMGQILRRGGRPDLAREFERIAGRQRPGSTCRQCGKPTTRKTSDACSEHRFIKRSRRGAWKDAA